MEASENIFTKPVVHCKQHNGIHRQNIRFHWGTSQTLNKNNASPHFQWPSRFNEAGYHSA